MSVPGKGHVQALHPVLIDPVEGLTLCHCEMVLPVPADACGRNISISEHTPEQQPPFLLKGTGTTPGSSHHPEGLSKMRYLPHGPHSTLPNAGAVALQTPSVCLSPWGHQSPTASPSMGPPCSPFLRNCPLVWSMMSAGSRTELHMGFSLMAEKEAFRTTEETAASSKSCPKNWQMRLTLPCRS